MASSGHAEAPMRAGILEEFVNRHTDRDREVGGELDRRPLQHEAGLIHFHERP